MAARINGPHACGHPSRFLSESQAARAMIAQWATEDCGACVRYQRDLDAIQAARELGLPDLTGTDKQVNYARAVREDARVMLTQYVDKHSTASDLAAVEALLYGISESRWWLDHKDEAADQLVDWVRPLVTIALGYKGA